MNRTALILGVLFLSATAALAAGPKTYQVTGPVLEVKEDLIVVQKGKEKWEIVRDKDAKVTGERPILPIRRDGDCDDPGFNSPPARA
jgi:hypothetical protein